MQRPVVISMICPPGLRDSHKSNPEVCWPQRTEGRGDMGARAGGERGTPAA